MASFEYENFSFGESGSAELSETLRNILEEQTEEFIPYFEDGSFLTADGELEWNSLPTLEQMLQDTLVAEEEKPASTPLALEPEVNYQEFFEQDFEQNFPNPQEYQEYFQQDFPQPSPLVLPTPETTVVPQTKSINKRSENIGKVNPANFYQPLPFVPMSWPANTETFQYNAFGELLPHLKYTPAQIMEYITEHPGNLTDHGYNGKASSLTMWIQTAPADSARRYPNPASDKCRFACCPVTNGSIHKGTFRVAFDEWSSSGMAMDPYHNAGYVHLYCLERFTPFSYICANFNVKPDTRIFAEGRNKMAITRDHEVFARFVDKYIRIVSKPDFEHQREYDYKRTLCHKLVKTHLEQEPAVRQKVREARGGNSLDIHLGDLEVYAAAELAKKAARDAQKPPKVVKASKNSKRKRDDEVSPDMDDIFGDMSSKRARM